MFSVNQPQVGSSARLTKFSEDQLIQVILVIRLSFVPFSIHGKVHFWTAGLPRRSNRQPKRPVWRSEALSIGGALWILCHHEAHRRHPWPRPRCSVMRHHPVETLNTFSSTAKHFPQRNRFFVATSCWICHSGSKACPCGEGFGFAIGTYWYRKPVIESDWLLLTLNTCVFATEIKFFEILLDMAHLFHGTCCNWISWGIITDFERRDPETQCNRVNVLWIESIVVLSIPGRNFKTFWMSHAAMSLRWQRHWSMTEFEPLQQPTSRLPFHQLAHEPRT